MKATLLILLTMTVQTLGGDDTALREAKKILATAKRMETTRIMEAGMSSAAGVSFVKLFTSSQAGTNFEELAETAQTSAGKAYAIIGLYEIKRDRALAILNALPSDFRVHVMWFDLKYEWSREEFERHVKERRFFEALMRPE